MSKTIVIMLPTVNKAVYEWKAFLSRWSTIIKKANRRSLSVELLSGHKIYFKGETEGIRALLGFDADIIRVDEFVMPQESEEISDTNMKMWEELFKAERSDKE